MNKICFRVLPAVYLVYTMLEQQAPHIEKIKNNEVYNILFSKRNSHHREHIVDAINYIVARRELDKNEERQFLLKVKDGSDSLVSKIAKHLLKSPLWA